MKKIVQNREEWKTMFHSAYFSHELGYEIIVFLPRTRNINLNDEECQKTYIYHSKINIPTIISLILTICYQTIFITTTAKPAQTWMG